jgi:quercetin dioxygenase-like cupin family protein
MSARPLILTATEDLVTENGSERFEGTAYGAVGVSFFLNHTAPGQGPASHRHPYPEVFIVHAGEATFLVERAEWVARSGQVVVVPANATHRFRNTGSDALEMTSLHPSAEMITQWETPPTANVRPAARRKRRPGLPERAASPTEHTTEREHYGKDRCTRVH